MLLPSPTTSDANGAGAHGAGGPDLRTALAEHLMPTPRAGDGEKGGPNQRGMADRGQPLTEVAVNVLLPTPAVNDMGAAYTPETWDAWTARMKAAHNNGNGHGNSLSIEAQRVAMALLPTPKTQMHTKTSAAAREKYGSGDSMGDVVEANRWGKYAAAIARWERVTRPAPEPTNITEGYLNALAKRLARQHAKPVGMRGSLKVRRQLSARFSEWMMGVPLGWITDVPGITRNEALKAAGNGVVPQQAAEGLRFLLAMPTGREIADAHQPDGLFELLEALS